MNDMPTRYVIIGIHERLQVCPNYNSMARINRVTYFLSSIAAASILDRTEFFSALVHQYFGSPAFFTSRCHILPTFGGSQDLIEAIVKRFVGGEGFHTVAKP